MFSFLFPLLTHWSFRAFFKCPLTYEDALVHFLWFPCLPLSRNFHMLAEQSFPRMPTSLWAAISFGGKSRLGFVLACVMNKWMSEWVNEWMSHQTVHAIEGYTEGWQKEASKYVEWTLCFQGWESGMEVKGRVQNGRRRSKTSLSSPWEWMESTSQELRKAGTGGYV